MPTGPIAILQLPGKDVRSWLLAFLGFVAVCCAPGLSLAQWSNAFLCTVVATFLDVMIGQPFPRIGRSRIGIFDEAAGVRHRLTTAPSAPLTKDGAC